jgi:PHP family Zn ribbon phosphoesterase
MSPAAIIQKAVEMNLDIIGIADHNSTLHCALMADLGHEAGLMVLPGAEVTTREEVHCLAFFETLETAASFQEFIESRLPYILNDPDRFGDQIVLDREERIIDQPPLLLTSGLQAGIEEVEEVVHNLNGLFIPAHVDRPRFSLISQLGFIPSGLKADAFEVSRTTDAEQYRQTHHLAPETTLLKNSDAHFLKDIGRSISTFMLEKLTFDEIRMALHGQAGRKGGAS